MSASVSYGVLTISDRCCRGEAIDTSGPALCDAIEKHLAGVQRFVDCVPDDAAIIQNRLVAWATASPPAELVLTTGGTGLSPRDVTPEATKAILEREHAGLMELMRLRCYEKTPRAYLSRGVAGTVGRSLVINLPGSQKGAVESFEAVADLLPHALGLLRDDPDESTRHQTPSSENA